LGESLFDESFRIFHEAQELNFRFEVCLAQEEFDQDGGVFGAANKGEGIKLL
jgi:hypothetical protein